MSKPIKAGQTSGAIAGIGLGLSIASLLLFSWLAGEVLHGETVRFDESVRTYVHAHGTPGLTIWMKLFTAIGSSILLAPVAMIALLIFWRRREFCNFATLAMTWLGATALEVVLKLAFRRPRPVPFFDLPTPHSFSFPSGHALTSFCLLGALALLISPGFSGTLSKAAVYFLGAGMVAAIGFSRVYLGVHYPTDVLAGYVGGFLWLGTVGIVNQSIRRRHGQ